MNRNDLFRRFVSVYSSSKLKKAERRYFVPFASTEFERIHDLPREPIP